MILEPVNYWRIKNILGPTMPLHSQGGFFLKKITSNTGDEFELKVNSKCNFVRHEKGILIFFSINNKEQALPILYASMITSEYKEGKVHTVIKKWSWRWVFEFVLKAMFINLDKKWIYKQVKESNYYILKTLNLEIVFISMANSDSNTINFFKPFEKKM